MSPTSAEFAEIVRDCFRSPEEPSCLEKLDRFLRPRLLPILVAIYRKDPSLAEDAYHSAFVRYIKIFREGEKPDIDYEAYFVAVAKHCLIDEIRRVRRLVPFDQLVEDEVSIGRIGDADRTEARITMLMAIAKLEARCRFVLQSYYIEGMAAPELARRLNLAGDSIHMALKRCRDRLRELFITR